MSHDDLRHDTECQNCGHEVTQVYCPHCGQKNTETRQSFAHLVGHFAEDLTHYDSGFWKTIKFLLLRPAKLTKEYLIGKRQQYVLPVKLYIFISFITFFIPPLLPDFSGKEEHESSAAVTKIETVRHKPSLNHQEFVWIPTLTNKKNKLTLTNPVPYNSVKQMDSIEALKPEAYRLNYVQKKMAKHYIELFAHNTAEQIKEKFVYGLIHIIPKALFFYLPLFAFWLWLFHGKRRWYFFDHAIFTLHYFSFLLLSILITFILNMIFSISDNIVFGIVDGILKLILFLWMFFYFFRAHRNMYHETMAISFLKSSALFVINFVSIIFVMILFMIITIYTLH